MQATRQAAVWYQDPGRCWQGQKHAQDEGKGKGNEKDCVLLGLLTALTVKVCPVDPHTQSTADVVWQNRKHGTFLTQQQYI